MTPTVVAEACGGPEVLALQDIELPLPIGLEVAGGAAAGSPGATAYTGAVTVADEIVINISAGYSELVLANAADLGHEPTSVTFEQAARLRLAGGTAWHLLTNAGVGMGDTVPIDGADGVRASGTVDAALDLVGTDEALDTSVEMVVDRKVVLVV